LGRFLIDSVFVLAILLLFSVIGAITFPNAASVSGSLAAYGQDLLLFIVPALLMTTVGYFLGLGIRGIKAPLGGMGLGLISSLIVGSVLALLTTLNFAYSAHLNFTWLGGSWYAPWVTMFLIGSPIMVVFLA
jgi:hypothetical protein